MLIAEARQHKSRIVNALSKSISTDKKQSEILSQLLQGYEAAMLNIVLELAGDRLIILQHDGWVCESGVDLDAIRQAIERQLDLTIQIEQELDYSNINPKQKIPDAITD